MKKSSTNTFYFRLLNIFKTRVILYNLFFLFFHIGFGQDISTGFPDVIPPSPTVASLMKFEEIPVNNYTGIPNISIPIYSIETLSKDVSLDLSLNYHPSSIAVNEIAGYTGLGWSLFAGGTISRTIRGYPDEYTRLETASAFGTPKIGIYDESENKYNQLKEIYTPGSGVYHTDFPEYIWDVHNRGLYDTEHDLYQFNFMGRTGRFYVKKTSGNILEVEKLDYFIEKVIVNSHYDQASQKHIIKGFIIYDDKGIRYNFDTVERQYDNQLITTRNIIDFSNTDINVHTSPYYNSAYHLTTIIDTNDKTLVLFEYQNVSEKAIYTNRITNEFLYTKYTSEYRPLGLPNASIHTRSTYNIDSKKIKKIIITGKASIEFSIASGREDYNLEDAQNSVVLNSLWIRDVTETIIKNFHFGYEYIAHSTKFGKRLFLSSISENYTLYHFFKYKRNSIKPGYTLNVDPWGYFTTEDSNYKFFDKTTTDPDMCTTDVLQKMTLPTGGSIVFDFQSNTYSYMGNSLVTDFSGNRDNYRYHTQSLSINAIGSSSATFCSENLAPPVYIQGDYILKEVRVFPRSPLIPINGYALQDFGFKYKKNGVLSELHAGCREGMVNCYFTIADFSISSQYQICFENLNFDNPNQIVEIEVVYIYEKSKPEKYTYGGGIRINKIGHFDIDVPQDFYSGETGGYEVTLQKTYTYEETIVPIQSEEPPFILDFTPYKMSTGSLVYPKPIHERYYSKDIGYEVPLPSGPSYDVFVTPFSFIMRSEKNFISGIEKNGAPVGYKNVIVSDMFNGTTAYTYTSPIDFPERSPGTTAPSYPFLPSRNFEYKRGLLLNEKTYKKASDFNSTPIILKEVDYTYNYLEEENLSGIKIYSQSDCPALELYHSYGSFFVACMNTTCAFKIICDPNQNITTLPFMESYGWSKLISKTTNNHFYSDFSQNIVQTVETFDYNATNKKLKEHTVTNSLGEVLKTNYSYDGNTAGRNRIGVIKRIDTKRGNMLLESKDISYVNTFAGNTAYLPQKISVSKGDNVFESRIEYLKYDEFSNPLEVKQESGIHIVYLWGYNKSQPIAKIENATYAQVTGALGTTTISEANLGAIDNLRTNPIFSNAMITTYTYRPLIGVASVTDPRGYKTTYHYDAFGRLEFIKDMDGNILEENTYHYRTQPF